MTGAETVIIITTLTTGVVSCINAVASGWGRKEVKNQAEVVKQVAKQTHEEIVNKVNETQDVIQNVVNGSNLISLGHKIDRLSERVGSIEIWMERAGNNKNVNN